VVGNDAEPGEVQEEEPPKLLKVFPPGTSMSHWQVYGEVPPLKVAEREDVCPWSMVDGVPEGALTTKAELTVTVDVAVAVPSRESVTL
jgi:hypothetical protein